MISIGDKVPGTGLLPTFGFNRNAKFQLEVEDNKDVIFFFIYRPLEFSVNFCSSGHIKWLSVKEPGPENQTDLSLHLIPASNLAGRVLISSSSKWESELDGL